MEKYNKKEKYYNIWQELYFSNGIYIKYVFALHPGKGKI